MSKKKRYDILSPDGIGMYMDKDFTSPEKAEQGFIEWAKRFERQGYYSFRGTQIPLAELREYCKLVSY